jgi:formylglycine-generating enzyme required for sulfatase activity
MVLSGSLACAVAGGPGKKPLPQAAEVAAEPEAAPLVVPRAGIELLLVKGGCFQMGNSFEAGGPEEKPVHEVCVDDFYIGRYEVTRDQWEAIMGSAPPSSNPECGGACPAEMISWDDAQAFLAKLNAGGGGRESLPGSYRLPTEAEWEYAARSGGKRERWAGPGTDVDSLAWHYQNGGVPRDGGEKAPNGLGLYDMSGNVWEWTGDWYGETYYSVSPRSNPGGPASGERRVLRGGSAACPPFDLRTTYRNYLPPAYRGAGKGFRLVMTVAPKPGPAGTVLESDRGGRR